jgi:hypothetical protein
VLFRYYAAKRSAHWVAGAISGGPKSKQGRFFYKVKLDNGENRWGAADQFRRAKL